MLLLILPPRLVGPTGAPDVARQLMRLRLSAVWVTMVAFESPVPVPGRMEGKASLTQCPQHLLGCMVSNQLLCMSTDQLCVCVVSNQARDVIASKV